MYVQTKAEAVNLLLNSLVADGTSECQISAVRDIGWPIEVLTILLYEMKRCGVVAPLYFRGVPDGYEFEFFRGQLDQSRIGEFNPAWAQTVVATPLILADFDSATVSPF